MKHLVDDVAFIEYFTSKRTGENFSLKTKKIQKTKTKVRPKVLFRMALQSVAASDHQERKTAAKIQLKKIILSTTNAKVDKSTLMDLKQQVEDATEIAKEEGVFANRDANGKIWLALAARCHDRLDDIVSSRETLLKDHTFMCKQLSPLFPYHKKGKGVLPSKGCVEIVESLVAMTGVQHFDENGYHHKSDLRERWDMMSLDFKSFIAKTGDEKENVDKSIRCLNPLNIANDVAVGSGHRLEGIDLRSISSADAACGYLLPYLIQCLSLQAEHSKDLNLLKALELKEEREEKEGGEDELVVDTVSMTRKNAVLNWAIDDVAMDVEELLGEKEVKTWSPSAPPSVPPSGPPLQRKVNTKKLYPGTPLLGVLLICIFLVSDVVDAAFTPADCAVAVPVRVVTRAEMTVP